MIGWGDVYKVVVAMVPLYFALILGFGSVRWWRIFTPEQCGAINRFVCFFTLPLFTFEFTAHVDPYKWNYRFIGADAISKLIIVAAIVWLTILLFVLEFRRTGSLDVHMISGTNTSQSVELGEGGKDVEGLSAMSTTSSSRPSFWYLMKAVWLKLGMNPNSYAVFIGIGWAFISSRWHIELPSIMEGSVLIMSKAGMVLRFIAGPAAMAIGSIAVGLHGDVLRVAIIQAALPQSITSFIFAKEYGLHAEVLSTAVIFGMIVSLPVLIAYYAVLEFVTSRADTRSGKSRLCNVLPAASLLCLLFLILTLSSEYKEENQYRPYGSEALPQDIVSKTSNLEMRPLWNEKKKRSKSSVNLLEKKDANSTNLFAMAVGIKQKDLVSKMVKKFLSSGFVVMLFHYDGIVDEWKEFQWSDLVIHVSAINQTKWWFAKRFLHPDIVAEYSYIFLWDEDLGVENFHPKRYVSIVQKEGLEISQPALDYSKSEVHHQITARLRGSIAHRRTYKASNNGNGCHESSTAPPCTGWIEVMAPVFSRAAWRCVWHMIQGDRTKKVGVVDAEYIIHYGRPTLGGSDENEESSSKSSGKDHRVDVRRESYNEMKVFKRKWERAVKDDKCWIDPYK
ncbi:hypothetical protein ACE6H2_022572 [Prunus campanulata]